MFAKTSKSSPSRVRPWPVSWINGTGFFSLLATLYWLTTESNENQEERQNYLTEKTNENVMLIMLWRINPIFILIIDYINFVW